MRERWDSRDPDSDWHNWLNETAEDLRVSAVACKWRCYNLGYITKRDLADINDRRLVANGRPQAQRGRGAKFRRPKRPVGLRSGRHAVHQGR